ncbi:hypothetical protein CRE_16605 [Caenorhabditis remanei]|uniref:Uncharacterized protein n=1 Tax=Caenorhabditis remanei TaxID=31234 RepID=E3MAN3_CAERE|nr:hypothetical protein CRE_16605 [Caenorhabditis remanei]
MSSQKLALCDITELNSEELTKFVPANILKPGEKNGKSWKLVKAAKRIPKHFILIFSQYTCEIVLHFTNSNIPHSWKLMESNLANSLPVMKPFNIHLQNTSEMICGTKDKKNIVLATVNFFVLLNKMFFLPVQTILIESGVFELDDQFFQTTKHMLLIHQCNILRVYGSLRTDRVEGNKKCELLLNNIIVTGEISVGRFIQEGALPLLTLKQLDILNTWQGVMSPEDVLKNAGRNGELTIESFSFTDMRQLIRLWLQSPSTDFNTLFIRAETQRIENIGVIFEDFLHKREKSQCCHVSKNDEQRNCRNRMIRFLTKTGIDFQRADQTVVTVFYSSNFPCTFAMIVRNPEVSPEKRYAELKNLSRESESKCRTLRNQMERISVFLASRVFKDKKLLADPKSVCNLLEQKRLGQFEREKTRMMYTREMRKNDLRRIEIEMYEARNTRQSFNLSVKHGKESNMVIRQVEQLRADGMGMTLWIGLNKSDVEIKCSNQDRDFCWRFMKQNNPETDRKDVFTSKDINFRIIHSSKNGISLKTRKGFSVFSMLAHACELQSLFRVRIDTIVIDEDIFDSAQKSQFLIDTLAGSGCQSCVIRLGSNDSTSFKSEKIIELLNKVKVHETLNIQVCLTEWATSTLQKMAEIPIITTRMNFSYNEILKCAGKNSTFNLNKCGPIFINQLMRYITGGLVSNIGILKLQMEEFEYKKTDVLFEKMHHRQDGKPNGPFERMTIIEQLPILIETGINICRNDGAVITVFFVPKSRDNAMKAAFVIHIEYPWNEPLIERMPAIIADFEEDLEEYEEISAEHDEILTMENILSRWQIEPAEGEEKEYRAELMTPDNEIKIKRVCEADNILEAKTELRMFAMERKLEEAHFIELVARTAEDRKRFGVLTYGVGL